VFEMELCRHCSEALQIWKHICSLNFRKQRQGDLPVVFVIMISNKTAKGLVSHQEFSIYTADFRVNPPKDM